MQARDTDRMQRTIARSKRKSCRLTQQGMVVFCLIWLTACGSPVEPIFEIQAGLYLTRHKFNVCHGFGCSRSAKAGINGDDWDQVRAVFYPTAHDAAEERTQLANAIALMETIVGVQAGTAGDKAGSSLIGRPGQMDCIDEAVNTTTYMALLARENLLAFHDLGPAVLRGNLISRPSNTATIIEHETGAQYTVDSYFHKNGEPPEIIPVELWMTGWTPSSRDSNADNS